MKTYKCPDCNNPLVRTEDLVKKGKSYYCKECEEYWSKKFIEKK